MRGSRRSSPHPDYAIYDYEVVDRIPKNPNHRLVITEISPLESWRELRQTPAENTWLWWLSVNNAPDQRARYFSAQDGNSCVQPVWKESINRGKIPHSILHKVRTGVTEFISLKYSESLLKGNIRYLAQSEYAVDFCAVQLGKPAVLVSDYLRELPAIKPGPVRKKMVTYNGARGYSLVGELEHLFPDIEFTPIGGMNYQQVCEILSESNAYLELGHLPGRDRLPREAGRLGTPVVLLERGAGVYQEDFPLPKHYRIPFSPDWATNFASALQSVTIDRYQATQEQSSFREWILGDKERFNLEVANWIPLLMK